MTLSDACSMLHLVLQLQVHLLLTLSINCKIFLRLQL